MLGLTVDKLNELRSNSEIFGYRDGTSWKFKMQEIERVADEFAIVLNTGAPPNSLESEDLDADSEFDLSLDDDDLAIDLDSESASIDDDEIEFEVDAESAEISLEKTVEPVDDQLSDELELDDESGVLESESLAPSVEEDSQGDLLDGDEDFSLQHESEIDSGLVADDEPVEPQASLSFGSSDIRLAKDDDDESEDSADLLLDDEPVRSDPSTGKLLNVDHDDLMLSDDDLFDDELSLSESHEDSSGLSSDFERSSDLILEDSDSSAEVAALEDQGEVSLSDDDSEDFELSGSGLLELSAGEDEDDDLIVLDEPADFRAPTQLQDDDFNLTPLEELADEESSGSQVIALDDSDMYSDDSASTLLSPSDEMEAEPMLTEDAIDIGDFGAFETGIPGMTPGMAMATSSVLPEQPYSVWQVASLASVTLLLGLGGLIGYDLARNLWLPQDQILSGGVMNIFLGLFG